MNEVSVLRIKELRKINGIKQNVLAKDMAVSQPTVSDWESGNVNPSIENLIALSKYFSVTVGCVIGTEPIPEGYPENYKKPVLYNEAIQNTAKAAEDTCVFKPTKKPPFSRDQMEYLNEWGDRLKDSIVEALKEDSSSLKEPTA